MSEDLQRELAGLGEGGDPRGVEMGAVERRVGERRRRRAAAVASVLACLVAVPLGWTAVGGTGSRTGVAPVTAVTADSSVVGCPTSLVRAGSGTDGPPGPVLPTPPDGLDLAGRLTPAGTPRTAVVCRYEDSDAPGAQDFVGGRAITQGVERISADLREVREDAPVGGCLVLSRKTPYLLRLDFAEGSVWLSAEDDDTCGYELTSTTNGGVTAFDHVGKQLAAAYADGVWPGLDGEGCSDPWVQRRGSREQLAPTGAVSATVCRREPGNVWRQDQAAPGTDTMVAALGRAELRGQNHDRDNAAAMQCGGSARQDRLVVLRYARGPAVVVRVSPGCNPTMDNGSRRADLTPELRELLDLPAES